MAVGRPGRGTRHAHPGGGLGGPVDLRDRLRGRFGQTYGAVAAVAVLMLWLYLSTLIVLLGAEVNGAIERHLRDLSG